MQGTVLVLDGIATNRIMLRVQLSASYYHVVQGECLDGAVTLARRVRPDLIISAMSLPDGDAIRLNAELSEDPALAGIPLLAITPENDRAARIAALEAGIDDVLSQPVDDQILQARIRALLRARSSSEELQIREDAPAGLGLGGGAYGFGEPPAPVFAAPARVGVVTNDPAVGARWEMALQGAIHGPVAIRHEPDLSTLLKAPGADAIVIEISDDPRQTTLGMLAELRARSATRDAAIIAVVDPPDSTRAAEALDRGAHDVMLDGFCAEELALRLTSQLRRKARADRIRNSVTNGLKAAMRDPMTGLYNRRYALPHLAETLAFSQRSGTGFAVMLADLDHFKKVNDRHGHRVGDAVLIEAAERLRAHLHPNGMIARVGGEEFLIVIPGIARDAAIRTADLLCREINATPFWVAGQPAGIPVTISIGVVVAGHETGRVAGSHLCAETLIDHADRALYAAKNAGRNKAKLVQAAA